jgi:hypothetical protein
MSSPSHETDRPTDHPPLRTARYARNALIWLGLILVALFPFPWWW